MLGQQGLGLPNLAALGGGGAAAATISAIRVDSANVIFGADLIAPPLGAIFPIRFDNQNIVFSPVMVILAVNNISPSRVDNFNAFPVHNFMWNQILPPLNLVVNANRIFDPSIEGSSPEPTYNFPIGRSLDSDYGIRGSMTFYKQTLVIGRN